jgi:hypothetical protein
MDDMDIAPTVHAPHGARTALTDLPDEIITAIMLSCTLRDVEALGATCRALHAVARDDSLWRRLFRRDYGCFYEPSVAVGLWACDVRTDAPWPDEALPDGMSSEAARSLLPPDGDPSLPPPFARMRAAGKDHRWLCIAHESVEPDEREGRWPTSLPFDSRVFRNGPGGKVSCESVIYVGDTRPVLDGRGQAATSPCDYGVLLALDANDRIVAWREGWRTIEYGQECSTLEWGTVVTRDERTLLSRRFRMHDDQDDPPPSDADAARPRARLVHRVTRRSEWREWFTTIDGARDGRQVAIHPRGATSYKIAHKGKTVSFRFVSHHGIVTVFDTVSGVAGPVIESVGRTVYPNGDTLHHTRRFRGPDPVVAFCVSDACPDRSLAGRLIHAVRWATESVSLSSGDVEWAVWTTGDTEDDRLFRDYVLRGLMDWQPAVQAVAAQRIVELGRS